MSSQNTFSMASKVTDNACGFCHSDALGKQVCAEHQGRSKMHLRPLALVFAKVLPIKKKKCQLLHCVGKKIHPGGDILNVRNRDVGNHNKSLSCDG